MFHYLMDLHYSQTWCSYIREKLQFHYLMDLHYSQTCSLRQRSGSSFTTLWIYTILKLGLVMHNCNSVSLPYGFTLFSNLVNGCLHFHLFHYLMDLHYSQTCFHRSCGIYRFHYLMDLHYSQTVATLLAQLLEFHYLMDLHYSQTNMAEADFRNKFHYLMDLHYSQTK